MARRDLNSHPNAREDVDGLERALGSDVSATVLKMRGRLGSVVPWGEVVLSTGRAISEFLLRK